MFYRVVMQGRVVGGSDIEEVKRQFMRVTGLPAHVADEMLGGTRQVVKQRIELADAERIAATLRAIGAAAIVERELPGSEDETEEGVQVFATPLHAGPPTIIPGSEPMPVAPVAGSRYAKLLRKVVAKWPWLAGVAVLAGAAFWFAPFVEDMMTNATPVDTSRPVVAPISAAPAEIARTVPEIDVRFISGPWRCTNQRTGVAVYWTYGDDGSLVFHGDVLRDSSRSLDPAAPTGWKLDGQQLLHTFAQGEPVTYRVVEMSLAHLRYGDGRALDIHCRRP